MKRKIRFTPPEFKLAQTILTWHITSSLAGLIALQESSIVFYTQLPFPCFLHTSIMHSNHIPVMLLALACHGYEVPLHKLICCCYYYKLHNLK